MSKLIISQIDVFTGAFGTASGSSYVGSIKNLVIDGLQYYPEPNQTVIVEDGQTINESYNVPIEIRTRNLSFETGTQVADSSGTTTGSADGENMLTGSNSPFMIEDSTDSKTECFLRFVSQSRSLKNCFSSAIAKI